MSIHTFVIPVYKESAHLETCIKSLLGQTAKSEILITTSTPTIKTKLVAEKYSITYIVNSSGQTGIAADWNFALLNAQTPLVTIAHQDDIYACSFAEHVIAYHNRKNARTLISFTDYADLVNDTERRTSVNGFVKKCLLLPFAFNSELQSGFFKRAILLFGNPICCPSVTFNMRQLESFWFNNSYKYVLDWYAWYQLARRKGSFVFINKQMVKHRLHIDSETTNQLNTGLRKVEELQLFETMWGKRIAKVIAQFYTLGHKENIT